MNGAGTSRLRRRVASTYFKHQPRPRTDDWLLKIIAIEDRFVLGLYRRQMKAITYLGKIEKMLGVPATTRNWNTIEKVVKILSQS